MIDLDTLAAGVRRFTVEVTSAGGATGAGVVWSPEWILTNAHVIRGPRAVVRLPDGRRVEGRVVAGDPGADLAVLRVPHTGVPPAPPAASGSVRVGALVVAVGHPLGVRDALTSGIVHAVGPIAPRGRPWIQADLRLAPGNSGGPLADARGRLVGVNAMVVGGLALAIPLDEVRRFLSAVGGPPG